MHGGGILFFCFFIEEAGAGRGAGVAYLVYEYNTKYFCLLLRKAPSFCCVVFCLGGSGGGGGVPLILAR